MSKQILAVGIIALALLFTLGSCEYLVLHTLSQAASGESK